MERDRSHPERLRERSCPSRIFWCKASIDSECRTEERQLATDRGHVSLPNPAEQTRPCYLMGRGDMARPYAHHRQWRSCHEVVRDSFWHLTQTRLAHRSVPQCCARGQGPLDRRFPHETDESFRLHGVHQGLYRILTHFLHVPLTKMPCREEANS